MTVKNRIYEKGVSIGHVQEVLIPDDRHHALLSARRVALNKLIIFVRAGSCIQISVQSKTDMPQLIAYYM